MPTTPPQFDSQAEMIIAKFGGLWPMARALGMSSASTVQGWKARGFIPARRQLEILQAAERAGVSLEPRDFVRYLDANAQAGTPIVRERDPGA